MIELEITSRYEQESNIFKPEEQSFSKAEAAAASNCATFPLFNTASLAACLGRTIASLADNVIYRFNETMKATTGESDYKKGSDD